MIHINKYQFDLPTKCEQHSYTPVTFRHYELRLSLIAQKHLIIHEPSRKNTQIVQFTVQFEIFQENAVI